MSGELSYADVVAGVRAALAAYAHALDDGRTDDVVATFCPDGSLDMGRGEPVTGHDALRAAYATWVPQLPQRHVVVNTLVTEWSADEAPATATAVSDVVFLLKRDDGWAVQLVGRYEDVLHSNAVGSWRFHSRTARFS